MSQVPAIDDADVQYIATPDFMNTLLANRDDVPEDILDIMDERYDLIADPGADKRHRKGFKHESEWEFMWEYRQNKHRIEQHAEQLKQREIEENTGRGNVPFYLVAMALRRSPQGKRRVVLTDDPGLIELLQAYGIQTIRSREFIIKMQRDRVIDKQGREVEGKSAHGDPTAYSRDRSEEAKGHSTRVQTQRIKTGLTKLKKKEIAHQYDDEDDADDDTESTGGKSNKKSLGIDFD